MSIRAIHIPVIATESVRVVEIDERKIGDQISELVGGDFQCIALDGDLVLWLHEDGKRQKLPLNLRAQILWDRQFGAGTDFLVGSAIVTGGVTDEGDDVGLNADQLADLEQALAPIVRVTIEDTYEDGHESSHEVWVAPPEDLDDPDSIEAWWDEEVFPETGDGHGADHPGLGSYHEAVVVSGPAQLVGLKQEWDG